MHLAFQSCSSSYLKTLGKHTSTIIEAILIMDSALYTAPVVSFHLLPPYILSLSSIPIATVVVLATFVLICLHKFLRAALIKQRFAAFTKAAGCLPIPVAANPFPLPWSVGRKYEIYKASIRGDLFEGHFLKNYSRYGNTRSIVDPWTGQQKGINTVEPANIQTVLATRFDDYKRPEFRSLAAQPMLMPGLFTTDG